MARAMASSRRLHLHLLFCTALLALGGSAAAEVAAPTTPAPKSPPDPMAWIRSDPMIFYLAKGEGDACGAGCSEWIAAEGNVDFAAPQRLRVLLGRLGKRKLPIFFHSPGGLMGGAMEIGRILREREMSAGVSRTIPAGCIAAPDQACKSLKQSGQVVAAELHAIAGCNSGCVYALVGAKVRQVPPGAKLGVHSAAIIRLNRDGRTKTVALADATADEKSRVAESTARARRYLQAMHVGAGLFEVTSKTPYEQVYYLSRDEVAAFGIDTREFQETRWVAIEQPPRPPAVVKLIVEAKGPSRKEFRASMIKLACAIPQRVHVAYARGLGSDETAAVRSIKFTIAGKDISFSPKPFISKIEGLDSGGSFDTRSAYEPIELFAAAATADSLDVVETDLNDRAAPPRITKLSTAGLSKAIEVLQKSCGQPPSFFDAPEVKFLQGPGMGFKR
jgi:hypothetical protein